MSADEIAKGANQARQIDPIGRCVVLDQNLMAIFPPGSKVLEVSPAGASAWVKTVRIDVELADGTLKSYFKNVGAPGNRGRYMMEGTFESEKTVHSFAPENVPAPLGWGSYKSVPNMCFYVCDFVNMTDDLPDPAEFGKTLASLHKNSMGKSPNGYGFHKTTHLAFVPSDNTWATSWTEWFSNAMRKMFHEEAGLAV